MGIFCYNQTVISNYCYMKTRILLFSVFFLVLTSVASAETLHGGNGGPSVNLQERKEEMEEIRLQNQERIEAAKTQREENRVKLEQKNKDRVQVLSQNMFRRFKGFGYRFDGFIERIEERIVLLESKGVDVSEAKDLLVIAKDSIVASESVLEEAQKAFEDILSSEEVSRESIFEIFASSKDQFSETHAAIIDVVESLRANLKAYIDENAPMEDKNATSTDDEVEDTDATTTNEEIES